jgi:hypothetical protein
LQLAGEEFQADVGGAQLLGEHGQLDAAAQAFVLVDHEGDRGSGRADLAGQADRLLQFGAVQDAGGDLLGEHARDFGVFERVELGVQRLAGGRDTA